MSKPKSIKLWVGRDDEGRFAVLSREAGDKFRSGYYRQRLGTPDTVIHADLLRGLGIKRGECVAVRVVREGE